MTMPIVFIHWGKCWYLKYALANARQFSPGSLVCLVTDAHASLMQGIECIDMSRHNAQGMQFSQVYVHHSSLSMQFESRCFERWFILLDLMKARGWEKCLHLDSDVLLYADAQAEAARLDCDITISEIGASGHNCYITRHALQSLCDMIMDIYTHKIQERFDALESRRVRVRSSHLSDMTLIGHFIDTANIKPIDIAQARDGMVYNDNYRVAPAYVSGLAGVKVRFKDGLPYATHAQTGQEHRLMTIHFQGVSKRWMPWYARYDNGPGWPTRVFDMLRAECIHRIMSSLYAVKIFVTKTIPSLIRKG